MLLGALVLPALSLVVCALELTLAPSALRAWSAGQLATPESVSSQLNCTVSGLLYQPFAFGLPIAAALIVGAVLSTLTA